MFEPRMMPGQSSYTPEELEALERFVAWAAAGDLGELHELFIETDRISPHFGHLIQPFGGDGRWRCLTCDDN